MDSHTKPLVKKKLIEELRDGFANFPYAKIEVKDFEQGPPIEAPISVRIFGDNLDTLRKLSYDVEQVIKSNSGAIM